MTSSVIRWKRKRKNPVLKHFEMLKNVMGLRSQKKRKMVETINHVPKTGCFATFGNSDANHKYFLHSLFVTPLSPTQTEQPNKTHPLDPQINL